MPRLTNYFITFTWVENGAARTSSPWRIRATDAEHAKREALRLGGVQPEQITKIARTR